MGKRTVLDTSPTAVGLDWRLGSPLLEVCSSAQPTTSNTFCSGGCSFATAFYLSYVTPYVRMIWPTLFTHTRSIIDQFFPCVQNSYFSVSLCSPWKEILCFVVIFSVFMYSWLYCPKVECYASIWNQLVFHSLKRDSIFIKSNSANFELEFRLGTLQRI